MFSRINRAVTDRRNGLASDKGFTLIELLVVVIIIGILAAIAIPMFLNQRESAWRASVESDLKNAAIVVETFGTTNNGDYNGFTPTTAVTSTTKDAPFKVSANNSITVTVTKNSYSILGSNSSLKGKGGADDPTLTYKSDEGGIQKWTDAPTVK